MAREKWYQNNKEIAKARRKLWRSEMPLLSRSTISNTISIIKRPCMPTAGSIASRTQRLPGSIIASIVYRTQRPSLCSGRRIIWNHLSALEKPPRVRNAEYYVPLKRMSGRSCVTLKRMSVRKCVTLKGPSVKNNVLRNRDDALKRVRNLEDVSKRNAPPSTESVSHALPRRNNLPKIVFICSGNLQGKKGLKTQTRTRVEGHDDHVNRLERLDHGTAHNEHLSSVGRGLP